MGTRVQTLQRQNSALLYQMASAAKMLNAALTENQILKAELQALEVQVRVLWSTRMRGECMQEGLHSAPTTWHTLSFPPSSQPPGQQAPNGR
jgi:hypothetical protein